MNYKNIDIFLINKDYKKIYKKRLSNILRKNKKRLSGKAILFTDDDFYKSSDFESIKRIIDDPELFAKAVDVLTSAIFDNELMTGGLSVGVNL